MKQGQRVEVKLHGDESWYPGVVIKAKKMWVELDAGCYPGGPFIADECSIEEWRNATDVPRETFQFSRI